MYVRESNEYRRVLFIIQTRVSLQDAATCHHFDKTQLQKEIYLNAKMQIQIQIQKQNAQCAIAITTHFGFCVFFF